MKKSNEIRNDFMFQLAEEEYENLRWQKATSGLGGRRTLSYVFREQLVSMLSSILNSTQAIPLNISKACTVKMREWSSNYSELLAKINELQGPQAGRHGKSD